MGTVDLAAKRYFTRDQARAIATELGIDFKALGCDLEQFRMGLGVELEAGRPLRRPPLRGRRRLPRRSAR
jgi:hypothetical protein